MAASTDSTRAPARTPTPYVHRPSPLVADPCSPEELLAEIGAELDRQTPAAPEAARPRGKMARAIVGAWRGIEADAERTREAIQAAAA